MENKPFGVLDELSEKDTTDAYNRADEKFSKEHNRELELEPSSLTVSGQEWVLVSFVGKSCKQKTDQLGMKIWGAFANLESAKSHLKQIGKMEENKWYDIYILQMYSWAVIPPDPSCIEDQEYHDEKLNELISEHKKEKLRTTEVFDTRKAKLMANPDVNKNSLSEVFGTEEKSDLPIVSKETSNPVEILNELLEN